jgi:regulator of sigma E protease
MPTADNSPMIGEIIPGSPAEKAGLKSGDKIVAIDGQNVKEWTELVKLIHSQPEKELTFNIERNGQNLNYKITPQLDPENNIGLIGISPKTYWQKASPLKAIGLALERTWQIIALTFSAIIQMFTGKIGAGDVAGPVGIVQLIGESARFGLVYLVNLTALISINLGLLNLLPIPALDGSKLIFLAIEGLRGKPIDAQKENLVTIIGFALLMTFMLFVTYQDIVRLFDR